MRVTLFLILLLWLAGAASAELNSLLAVQKQGDPGAFVSSGFHDWRTVSKYRRNPGLHAGYDIAMLTGAPVRAAWPGKVVAITPWYGSEFGVTVQLQNGFEATYGHISPTVRLGDKVRPGEILGTVVVDHVDVKMRDPGGKYVDFKHLEFSPQDVELKVDTKGLLERFARLKREYRRLKTAEELGLVALNEVNETKLQLKKCEEVMLSLGLSTEGQESGSNSPEEAQLSTAARKRTDILTRAAHSADF